MTNQVNQAFEKWWYGTDANLILCSRNSAEVGYQAATKASESEINLLKQRVEELTTSNNQLRMALDSIASDIDTWHSDVAMKALSTTPAQ